jgi:hypothetical protein
VRYFIAGSGIGCALACAGALLLSTLKPAAASSATPFNFEYSVGFTNVYLMRVRDTSEGVVCYVVRDDTKPTGVSCVRESLPATSVQP